MSDFWKTLSEDLNREPTLTEWEQHSWRELQAILAEYEREFLEAPYLETERKVLRDQIARIETALQAYWAQSNS